MFRSLRVSSSEQALKSVVVAVFEEKLQLPSKMPRIKKNRKDVLQAALKAPGYKGEPGETFVTTSGDVVIGLGKRIDLTSDVLRTIGARLIKRLDQLAVNSSALIFSEAIPSSILAPSTVGRCLGEGMGLANWRVDFFAGNAAKNSKPHSPLTLFGSDPAFRKGLQLGLTLADHVNYARRIDATPPNICNPGWLTTEAKKLARTSKLRFKLVDFAHAKRLGMGGIVNVGKGSKTKPCLIMLEHKPTRVAKEARGETLALVGKTVTYDTGGYSLKINNTMKGMKYDKCGGIAVLAAMRAIADLRLPVHVVGIMPCAENMVSEDAYRPDDIITMYNDVSVEVTNTDAEGRLILADALAYACKDVKATTIVDVATLTGGIIVALGHFCSGVFCNDDSLLKRIHSASETSGERVWRMPLWNEHKEFMRSPHADILNSNPLRSAHPIQGAAFLAYFVDEKIPWAHIDIAGMMNVEKDTDFYVTGPTGYGVRLLVDLVREYT